MITARGTMLNISCLPQRNKSSSISKKQVLLSNNLSTLYANAVSHFPLPFPLPLVDGCDEGWLDGIDDGTEDGCDEGWLDGIELG